MKKILLILFLLFVQTGFLFAQGEINDDTKLIFKNEKSLAVLVNSNGFGGNFRFGKSYNARNEWLFDLDIVEIRHPKEIRIPSDYNPNHDMFVFGKMNCFYSVRTGIGNQKELFTKFDKGGISIRLFYTFGISWGLLKPVYYEVIYNTATESKIITERFDITSIHSRDDIYGKAPYFKGFDEMSLLVGGFLKTGLSFEYSSGKIINAIEAGVILDAFPKKVPIMATETNQQFILSLFVSYRFGRSYDRRLKDEE